MLRSLAVLVMAAFVATAGSAFADPGYTAHTLPTLSLFNRTGTTVKVEFIENGVAKSAVTLYASTSYVSITLKGSFVMTGSVGSVPITHRAVTLEAGKSFNLTVESNGTGGYYFKNGP